MAFQPIQIPVHGIELGGGRLDDGFYQPEIVAVDTVVKEHDQIEFSLEFPNGSTFKAWQTVPYDGCKTGLFKAYRAMLESVGFEPDELESEEGPILEEHDNPETGNRGLVGRRAHVSFKNGDRDTGVNMEIRFLTPAQWERAAQKEASAPTKEGPAEEEPVQEEPVQEEEVQVEAPPKRLPALPPASPKPATTTAPKPATTAPKPATTAPKPATTAAKPATTTTAPKPATGGAKPGFSASAALQNLKPPAKK
jgi:hypothetical protein